MQHIRQVISFSFMMIKFWRKGNIFSIEIILQMRRVCEKYFFSTAFFVYIV